MYKQVQHDKYITLKKFKADLMVIWQNCMTYNQDASPIFNLATQMQLKAIALLKREALWDLRNFNKLTQTLQQQAPPSRRQSQPPEPSTRKARKSPSRHSPPEKTQ